MWKRKNNKTFFTEGFGGAWVVLIKFLLLLIYFVFTLVYTEMEGRSGERKERRRQQKEVEKIYITRKKFFFC